MSIVEKYYNEHVQAEDNRLNWHAFEMPITLHYIEKYVLNGGKILDIACGTGKYAVELLKRNYLLGLNDLAEKNMELTMHRVSRDSRILYTGRADALESHLWNKKKWDAILLLGPLYHYTDHKHRIELLKKSEESLKPGGYIFAGFMNRNQAMVYGLKNNPEGIFKKDGAYTLWEKGHDSSFIESTEYFKHAYFSKPQEINPLIRESGLVPLHLIGCEGIFGERFELYHQMNKRLKKAWYEFILKHCEDEGMVYCSKHLLSISMRR